MTATTDILAWRYTDGGSDIEVLTADGWSLYSTGPNVAEELAELRAAGVRQATRQDDLLDLMLARAGADHYCVFELPGGGTLGDTLSECQEELERRGAHVVIDGAGWVYAACDGSPELCAAAGCVPAYAGSTMEENRDHAYPTREAALADGWDDANCGVWVPANGDLGRAKEGWIGFMEESCTVEVES